MSSSKVHSTFCPIRLLLLWAFDTSDVWNSIASWGYLSAQKFWTDGLVTTNTRQPITYILYKHELWLVNRCIKWVPNPWTSLACSNWFLLNRRDITCAESPLEELIGLQTSGNGSMFAYFDVISAKLSSTLSFSNTHLGSIHFQVICSQKMPAMRKFRFCWTEFEWLPNRPQVLRLISLIKIESNSFLMFSVLS